MIFSKVRLRNFRNLESVDTSFSPRLNVFLGENGQGKTNILEALFLLSQGDTFRYADNSVLIKKDEKESYLAAKIDQNNFDYEVKLLISKSKKAHFLNGKRTTSAEIRKHFASVIFSPESLSAIKEGADYRRQLIDDLLMTFEKNNSDLLADYKRALKTRNRILKNFLQEKQSLATTQELLEALEPTFLGLATRLTIKRIEALKAIQKDFNNSMQYISGNSAQEISIIYEISEQNGLEMTSEEIYDLMSKRILELRSAELSSGVSLVGPQKHDLRFLYGQNDSRFYCSQGQQRAIILSFKMAQIVYHRKAHGVYPVLMLDDVLSELDKNKRDSLVTFLHEINTQIFITTTDLTLPTSFSLDNMQVLNISSGKILS